MKTLGKYLFKTIYILAAVLAGVFLFTAQLSYDINGSLMNADFHGHLFEKNNIYSHVNSIISNSISELVNNIKKESPQSFEQNKEVFSLLEKSVTPELIKYNLDSIRNETFAYFKGEKRFLPDIYIKNTSKPLDGLAGNSVLSPALSKIDKINLSAILQYINRSDIIDYLSFVKFFYYIMSILPGYGFLMAFLLLLTGLSLCRRISDVGNLLGTALLTGGILGLLGGIALLIYTYTGLPASLYPVTLSLPLGNDFVISYMMDCSLRLTTFLIISGAAFLMLGAVLFYLPRTVPLSFSMKELYLLTPGDKTKNIVKFSAYFVLLTTVVSILIFKVNLTRTDFYYNDFDTAISKMRSLNSVTQVIAARKDGIYVVQVKVGDAKTGSPIPYLHLNISGKSEMLKKNFNETAITDETGTAKFNLAEGAFRLSFSQTFFPSDYQIPTPYFFDLKDAGTTIITINLEAPPEEKKSKWGIAEIEILDKENKPVSDLELTIDGPVSAPGEPDKVFSTSNSEGIAVFKLDEGDYKASFTPSKFPTAKFRIPPPLDITVTPDGVTRYTIRMVEAENAAPTPISTPSPSPGKTTASRNISKQ